MPDDDPSIASLRAAIKGRGTGGTTDEASRFEALARSYEKAVAQLIVQAAGVIKQVGDLALSLEDEVETFTSPAFPGRSTRIKCQRLRVTLGDDFLLFDPSAGAMASAMGQVKLEASRPIPFLIEKGIYLIRSRDDSEPPYWAYRSSDDLTKFALPFSNNVLVRILHAVFA